MAKELVLTDGKKVKIKQGKGIDLLHAQMKAKTSEEIPYALILRLAPQCSGANTGTGSADRAWCPGTGALPAA